MGVQLPVQGSLYMLSLTRKDLWLAPMSHCVVGRVVGGESCCDKEKTVNVACPSPPGNGWSDVSTARCVSVSATPMILRVIWVVRTTAPVEVSTTAKYVVAFVELLSLNATYFPLGLSVQSFVSVVVLVDGDCSLEESGWVGTSRGYVKSFTLICVAHTMSLPLSEDRLPNTESEGGSPPVPSSMNWLTPVM